MKQLYKALTVFVVLFLAVTMGFGGSVPFIVNGAGISPYYSISFAKNNLTVYQGQTFSDVLSVYAVSPLQTIALYYSGSSPSSGITASLSPSYGTPDFNSTVTIFIPGNTPPGNYSLRFVGNNGYYKVSTLLNITVLKSTFYITLNPDSGTVHAGNSTSFTATAYSNIAPQTVTWSYSAPQGVSVSLSSQTSGIGQPITVTASVSPNAVFNGSVPITIFANSNDSFSANATYTLTPQFYLTMSANPSSDGSVSPSSGWYNAGSVVTITATPNTGYKFAGWTGSGTQSYTGSNNPATVVMDSNIEETASFSIENVVIKFATTGLNNNAQGSILFIDPLFIDQNFTFSQLPYTLIVPYGTQVTYKWYSPILGGSNTQFVLNSVSGLETSQSATFTATRNGSIIANYIEEEGITFSANGLNNNAQGTVLVVNGQNYSYSQLPVTITAPVGTQVTFKWYSPVSGGAGTRFVWVSTSGLSTSQNGTITVTSNGGNVTATYQEQFYLTMNVNPSNAGSVSPASGWYNAGSSVQISATANSGYQFASWNGVGSGSYTGTNNPATVTMNSPVNETANFGIQVTIQNTFGGSASASYNGQTYYSNTTFVVPYGSQVTFTASASQGYFFSTWTGTQSSMNNTLTLTITKPTTEIAEFGYYITFGVSGLGSDAQGTVLTVNGRSYAYSQLPVTIPVNYGQSVSYSFNSPVYVSTNGIRYVWVSTSGLDNKQSDTFTPTQPGSVIGNYVTQYELTISVNPSGAGSTTPSGSSWYNVGTQVQISATANTGYQFASWSGSGSSSYTGTSNPVTITMNSPVTEVANFNIGITFSANGINNNAQSTSTVLVVNGQSYTYSQLPVTIYASPGSSVSFSWISPVSGGSGIRFVWTSTSGLSTSQNGSITVSSPGSVTATYQEQFYLTMNANPSSGGSVSPSSGWFNAGSQITISATPNNVFAFLNWTGSGSGSYTGTNNPATITMNGPITETANFGSTISFPTLTAYDVANIYTGYNYEFAIVGQAMYNDPVPLANQQLTIVVFVTSVNTGKIYNKTVTVTTNSQGWFYTGVQTIGGGYPVWGGGVANKELYIYYNGTFVKQLGGWAWGVYIPSVEAQGGSVSISVPSWDGLQLYSGIASPQGVLLPSSVTVEFNTVPNPGNYFEQYAFYGGHNRNNLLFATGQNPYQYTFTPAGYTGLTQITEILSTSAQAQMTFVITIPYDTILNFTLSLNGPNGYTTSWSGYIENLPHSTHYEAFHTFAGLPPGTYSWSITPTSVANIYNSQEVYSASPSSGTLNDNSSQTVYIVYGGKLYNVTFTESGLPSGTTWWVDFNGNNVSTTSQSIEFTNVPSGTFTYTAGPQYYYVSSNTRYYGGGSGSISVNTNTQQTISWVEQYEVITTFSPSYAYSTGVEPAPNANGVANTWVDSGASLTVIGAPADYWVVEHPFNTSPSMTPTSYGYTQTGGIYYYQSQYTITQPESITVKFEPEKIYVQESGLPNGTTWSVSNGEQTFQGIAGSSILVPWDGNDANTTVFGSVVYYNGTYYVPTNTVSFPISEKYNQWQTETINYQPFYPVTINAGPGGSVSWSVLPGMAYVPGIGLTHSGTVSAGHSLTVYIKWSAELNLTDNPNPGYAFTQWSLANTTPEIGYYPNSNPVVIGLTNVPGSVTANYKYTDYLKFTVSTNAPSAIGFTITLSNGQSQKGNTLTQPTVTFYVPYATYNWQISPTSATFYSHNIKLVYVAMPSSASATTNASVSINYVLSSSTFNYTWSESGLPSGTQWGIDVNGNNYTTTSSSLTETFSTGQTYSWSVINPSGYVGIPDSGSFSSPGSQSITFYTTPSVSISVNSSSGVAPLTVTYTASASGGSGNYEYNFYYMNNNQQYQWTGWQTSNTFTYTYNSNGKYSAMVEVEDTVTGATVKSNYVQVTVSAPPPLSVTISAYPMQGVAPLNVSFVSNVQGGSGSYSYYWTFGDGGTSTSANPSHTYTSPGTYNVQLEVTSGSQTAYSNTLTITVTQEQLQASINANPTSGVAPLTVTYTASATGGSGSYQYDFYYETNSGTFVWSGWQSSNSISYTYTVYTTVQAYVEVKDTVTGVMAMSSPVQVTITPPPLSVTANANPTSGTAPLTVSFTASTSGGSGGNSYSWNFGDGSTSTQQNPTHTYNNPGTYTATVTVTDSYGQQASASVTISVSPAPLQVSIHAYPTSGSEPLTVNFYSSVSGGVGNYQYYWTFGDGATSTQANPTYTYNNPGTYTVQLKVTSGPQTAYSNRITITVDYPPLHVSIRASTTYGNAPLTVHFYSTVSGGTGRYSYYWMFGDGGSSTAANPTHTYYKGGTYYVKLFVRSGSQSAYSNIITIKVVVPTYSYTFHESGLPTGAVWKVTMNGQTKSAGAGQSITFTGLSGSNSWSAPAVTVYEGPWWHRVRVTYYPHPSSGTVSGSGSTTISYMQ